MGEDNKQIIEFHNKAFSLTSVIVFAALTVFLLWIVFRGCDKDSTEKVKDNKATKDSIVNDALEAERIANAKVAVYKRVNDSLARERAILKQQVDLLEHQLNISKYEATKIAYKVGKAKIVHDTVAYVNNCDSLVNEVEQLTGWIDSYEERTGALVSEMEAELANKDSLAVVQTEVIRLNREALRQVSASYDVLYKDYGNLNKKRKRERFLNRVLAAAVLGLGVKVALSK